MALFVNILFPGFGSEYTPYFYTRNCFWRTLLENLAHWVPTELRWYEFSLILHRSNSRKKPLALANLT